MNNPRIIADITETVAQLGGAVLFDIAAVAAQCDDTCAVKWCEDSDAYVIRSANGTTLFLLDTMGGCIDAVAQ